LNPFTVSYSVLYGMNHECNQSVCLLFVLLNFYLPLLRFLAQEYWPLLLWRTSVFSIVSKKKKKKLLLLCLCHFKLFVVLHRGKVYLSSHGYIYKAVEGDVRLQVFIVIHIHCRVFFVSHHVEMVKMIRVWEELPPSSR
jgi:hypothetical protein